MFFSDNVKCNNKKLSVDETREDGIGQTKEYVARNY